jgi:histone H3/H4
MADAELENMDIGEDDEMMVKKSNQRKSANLLTSGEKGNKKPVATKEPKKEKPVKEKKTKTKKPKKEKKEGEEEKKRRRRKRTGGDNYRVFIYKVFKGWYPNKDYSISRKSMDVLNSIAVDMFKKIAETASTLNLSSGTKTMTANDIITASKMHLMEDLAPHAKKSADEALERYMKYKS